MTDPANGMAPATAKAAANASTPQSRRRPRPNSRGCPACGKAWRRYGATRAFRSPPIPPQNRTSPRCAAPLPPCYRIAQRTQEEVAAP